MRVGASSAIVLIAIGGAAHAASSGIRLDLQAGSLAAAIDAVGARTGTNIGTSEPRLLVTRLPELHLTGSLEDVLGEIARKAGARPVRLGPKAWQLVRLAPRARRPVPLSVVPPGIVVEGSKRGARLADDPAEVVHIGGEEVDQYGGLPDMRVLAARVPTLQSTDWGDGHDKYFLRGVADSSFTGASTALVGEYLGDQRLTYSAPDPDLRLYDISSVEVMEGPQGTLYGAGTLGGLIRIEPRAPALDQVQGAVWAGITSSAHGGSAGDAGAVLNLPLVRDRLALRLVGYDGVEPGYINDAGQRRSNVNRVYTRGGRAALRWAVAEGWTIDLNGVGQRIDNRDAPYADLDAPLLTRSSWGGQPSYNQLLGAALVVNGRLGGMQLRSTTGMVRESFGEQFEVLQPAYSVLFIGDERSRLLSQETRLSGGSTAATWVVGTSLLSTMDRETLSFGSRGAPSLLTRVGNQVRDITGYGEITHHLVGRLSITLGARYSSQQLSGEGADYVRPFHLLRAKPSHVRRMERHFLPSLGFTYKPDRLTTMFARYERGFRPGGLTISEMVQRFDGDRIETVDTGVRRGLAGRDRVALSITGAVSRWQHIQADRLGGTGLPYVVNIGNGRIHSLDMTAALRLARGWRLDMAGFVARGRLLPKLGYVDDDTTIELPNVVRDGATIALDYASRVHDGRSWRMGLRGQHVGRSLFGIGSLQAVPQGGYTTLAFGSSVRLNALDLTVDATNLLDSRANAFAVGTPFTGFWRRQITPLKPRTLRLGMRYDF